MQNFCRLLLTDEYLCNAIEIKAEVPIFVKHRRFGGLVSLAKETSLFYYHEQNILKGLLYSHENKVLQLGI